MIKTMQFQPGDVIKLAVQTFETMSQFLEMMHTHGFAAKGADAEHHRTHINRHEFEAYEKTLTQLFDTFKNGMIDAALKLEQEINW